jgi:hypothetical protein
MNNQQNNDLAKDLSILLKHMACTTYDDIEEYNIENKKCEELIPGIKQRFVLTNNILVIEHGLVVLAYYLDFDEFLSICPAELQPYILTLADFQLTLENIYDYFIVGQYKKHTKIGYNLEQCIPIWGHIKKQECHESLKFIYKKVYEELMLSKRFCTTKKAQ